MAKLPRIGLAVARVAAACARRTPPALALQGSAAATTHAEISGRPLWPHSEHPRLFRASNATAWKAVTSPSGFEGRTDLEEKDVKTISLADLEVDLLAGEGSADKVTLIDVRNPDETAHGMIPTAKLLPFPELQAALDPSLVPNEDFHDRYGFERPGCEDHIVFYCRSGVRSHIAASLALAAGYTRVQNYTGSWLEWNAYNGNLAAGIKP